MATKKLTSNTGCFELLRDGNCWPLLLSTTFLLSIHLWPAAVRYSGTAGRNGGSTARWLAEWDRRTLRDRNGTCLHGGRCRVWWSRGPPSAGRPVRRPAQARPAARVGGTRRHPPCPGAAGRAGETYSSATGHGKVTAWSLHRTRGRGLGRRPVKSRVREWAAGD